MTPAYLRKRRPKPHATWHLDEVYLKIDRRMVYVRRAVDAEGEVLDVLVEIGHAALKLMRKPLKKYAIVPERLVADDLRSYGAAARGLGLAASSTCTSVDDGRPSGREFASVDSAAGTRCDVSRAPGLPRNSSQHMSPPTTLSTSNAISRLLNYVLRAAAMSTSRGVVAAA
jgi:hypothetical protein